MGPKDAEKTLMGFPPALSGMGLISSSSDVVSSSDLVLSDDFCVFDSNALLSWELIVADVCVLGQGSCRESW